MSEGGLRTIWLQDLRWPEISEYLKSSDVVLVPVGATEQHGRHLPLSVDTGWAVATAGRAAELSGVLVAPPISYGWSTHHMGYPGTVTLGADTLRMLATDVAMSLIHHGFRRIVFVNGNRIANLPPLEIAAVQIKNRTGAFVGIADVGLIARREVAELCGSQGVGLDHAGGAETAFAMYWSGENVALDAFVPVPERAERSSAFSYTLEVDPAKDGNGVSYAVSPDEHRLASGPGGAPEDPAGATAELGRAMVEAIAANLSRFIDEVRRVELGEVRSDVPL